MCRMSRKFHRKEVVLADTKTQINFHHQRKKLNHVFFHLQIASNHISTCKTSCRNYIQSEGKVMRLEFVECDIGQILRRSVNFCKV